jgi:hypothetical protein
MVQRDPDELDAGTQGDGTTDGGAMDGGSADAGTDTGGVPWVATDAGTQLPASDSGTQDAGAIDISGAALGADGPGAASSPREEQQQADIPPGQSSQSTDPGAASSSSSAEEQQQVDIPPGQTQPTAPPIDLSGVNLCFTPLEAFTDGGMDHSKAYRLATHVFVEFDGTSAGFTRSPGEDIVDAKVHSPDSSDANAEKQCTPAYLIPGVTPKYGTREEILAALHAAVKVGDHAGEYSITSYNCESYARWLLGQAGLTAGDAPGGGGEGNKVMDLWQKWGLPGVVKGIGSLHKWATGNNWGV